MGNHLLGRLVGQLLGHASTGSPRLQDTLSRINGHEAFAAGFAEEALRSRASHLRDRARGGEPLDELLVEWFALAREAARRVLGLRPFDVQILGAIALAEGKVVEMATGEGKTLAAVLPASLHALTGEGVHVLTVNDYLARRDASWMGPLYELLGLRVGAVVQGMAIPDRREAWRGDVTYATANEAGFDFLRDHLARTPGETVHRPFHFALIDEADSILIDEARVPLVVAGGVCAPGSVPYRVAEAIARLRPHLDFGLDENGRVATLTDAGLARIEHDLGAGDLYGRENDSLLAAVHVALHAHALLRRDVDYVVKSGRIELVDEFKGRIADGRRWPDGIHTALEARERLPLTREGRILSSITLQSFVRLYPKVCGMTGTAATQARELGVMYELDVVVIPPNKPCIRADEEDFLFTHREAKEKALVDDIAVLHAAGRPVLVGTASVAESERLAGLLRVRGLSPNVLNARDEEREAAIVAEAGDVGALTISTNMAGRGTDIRLGGRRGERAERVCALGGLHVIGTNRHESRRIDNQLRGRAGRQGDPGSSRFYVSLQDDLFTRWGLGESFPLALRNMRADGPVSVRRLRAEIERGQRILEGQNLEIRRNLWRYDVLVEKQRQVLHARREDVLFGRSASLMAERAPERYDELVRRFGEDLAARVERDITLAHLDRVWSDHLQSISELKEGIHLRSLGGQDPLGEFHRAAVELFSASLAELEDAVVASFESARVTESGIDLEQEGLSGPSATWTYLLNDQPFGDMMTRLTKGLKRLLLPGPGRREMR